MWFRSATESNAVPSSADLPVRRLLLRHLVTGALLLGIYGVWIVVGRLPDNLSPLVLVQSTAWSIALFATVGAILAPALCVLGMMSACLLPRTNSYRHRLAAAIHTGLVVCIFSWLLLNEFAYTTTSQVIGPEAIRMLLSTPAAVLEGAWEMGGTYLIATMVIAMITIVCVYRISLREMKRLLRVDVQVSGVRNPSQPSKRIPATPTRHQMARSCVGWASPLSIGMVVLVALLAWQFATRPSEALTTVFRSAPPFRAFNLTRAFLGIDLSGPVPDTFGDPLMTESQYQAIMGHPRIPAPNIVFILLESVSANSLHCYGYPKQDITPHMDAMASDGIFFEHCVSPASFSSYSVVSLMTSLHMLRAPQNDHFADKNFPFIGLPRVLKLAGYELALFSSGNEAFDQINRFYPPEDFDAYYSHDTSGIKHPDCMRMDDHYAVGEFEKWLAGRQAHRPFYCGFYLQSPHFNYEVPEPWYSYYQPIPPLFSNGDGIIHIPAEVLPLLKNQYDNALRYADYWIGRIRSTLEAMDQWDNTIVVITADHGEAFMQHGLARHGVHLWEEMIHVPLIVHPGSAVRASLPEPLPSHVPYSVSGIDIAPTLAHLVGIRPHPNWQGLDVLAPAYSARNRPIFSVLQLTQWMEAVFLNKKKYIYDLTDIREYLFDLSRDPGEQQNLFRDQPQTARFMRDILGAWHTRQLTYYASENRPFTHYIGRYEPVDSELAHTTATRSPAD